MIAYTRYEIIKSMLDASILGICMCIFSTIIELFEELVPIIKSVAIGLVKYDKLISTIKIEHRMQRSKSSIRHFFSIIVFSIIFMLLSYYSLDGQIRLYMMIILFASFYVSKITFLSFFKKILVNFLDMFFSITCIFLRIVLLPLKITCIQKRQKEVFLYK